MYGRHLALLGIVALVPASISALLATQALRGDAIALTLTVGLTCFAIVQIHREGRRFNLPARAYSIGLPIGIVAALAQPHLYGLFL